MNAKISPESLRVITQDQHEVGAVLILKPVKKGKKKQEPRRFKIVENESGIPCRGKCAFGVKHGGNYSCIRPQGFEACVCVNRADGKNVYFEEIFKKLKT